MAEATRLLADLQALPQSSSGDQLIQRLGRRMGEFERHTRALTTAHFVAIVEEIYAEYLRMTGEK